MAAVVWALAVQLRGIVVLPEDLEQLIVADLCGIVFNFDSFGMPRSVAANVFVAGIRKFAAGVADARRGHARNLPEARFHSPETPCCKCSFCHRKLPNQYVWFA